MSFLIGLFAGAFGGLVGLGGGVIMIPLMVSFLKLSQHRAHGTSLVAIVFTGIVGAVTYYLHGAVNLKFALIVAIGAILTAGPGARFANSLPEWRLKRSYGGFVIFVSVMMLVKKYIPHIDTYFVSEVSKIAVLLISGMFAGFLSGMMGIGSGTIMVPTLVFFLGLSQQAAQGTALLVMVPAGAVGAWTHFKLDNVQKDLLVGLIVGIVAGTGLGGAMANRMPEFYLRLLFAAVLIWTGVRYLRARAPEKTAAVDAKNAVTAVRDSGSGPV
jgi:uncharacterized membrane protein YfcA